MNRARPAEILACLVAHDVEFISLEDGTKARVLSLSGLIDAKERSGRPKDQAVLPLLRATLDEIRRRS